jgi:hypothetical protein
MSDYPQTVYGTCRKCGGASDVTPRRFRCTRAWKDQRGVRWAEYACPQEHTDYWTVTRQVFAVLAGATGEGA